MGYKIRKRLLLDFQKITLFYINIFIQNKGVTMKINKRLTFIAISIALFSTQPIASFFDDNFEEEFVKTMQNFEKNIKAALKNKINQNLENNTKAITAHIHQQNVLPQQQAPQYCQQRTNSLAFANNDKAIKITELISTEAIMYSILVTNKKNQPNKTHESSDEPIDIATELQNLQTYIKNNFHSNAAEKTLQECINAIAQQHKNKLVNITSSNNDNQTTYTIEISNKKDTTSDDNNSAGTNKKNKKKKSNFFTPRKKAQKN